MPRDIMAIMATATMTSTRVVPLCFFLFRRIFMLGWLSCFGTPRYLNWTEAECFCEWLEAVVLHVLRAASYIFSVRGPCGLQTIAGVLAEPIPSVQIPRKRNLEAQAAAEVMVFCG